MRVAHRVGKQIPGSILVWFADERIGIRAGEPGRMPCRKYREERSDEDGVSDIGFSDGWADQGVGRR
jgi:hypothetical protein